MYERHHTPPLTVGRFIRRMALHALYSGLAFIAVIGILLAPVVHRVLHRFHWDEGKGGGV